MNTATFDHGYQAGAEYGALYNPANMPTHPADMIRHLRTDTDDHADYRAGYTAAVVAWIKAQRLETEATR